MFKDILRNRVNLPDIDDKVDKLEVEEYAFRVLESLLIPLINKDVAGKFNNQLHQAILDKLMYDMASQQVSYELISDLILGLESYTLRMLIDAIPDIDSEDVFVDSITRVDKTTVIINVLKCTSLLISSRYV